MSEAESFLQEDAHWRTEMFDDLNTEWDQLVATMDASAAAEFVERLSRNAPPGAILDLGCGQGRLLKPLARMGRSVVGVDRSPAQLQRAAALVSGDGNVTLLRADMRHLPLGGPLRDLALCVRCYTSLGYFSRDEERGILSRLCANTVAGGAVVVDTFNWDWVRLSSPIERSTDASTFRLIEKYVADEDSRVIRSTWTYEFFDSRPTHSIEFNLDGYDPTALTGLLADAGWEAIEIFRGYSADVARPDDAVPSERLVGVGRAPRAVRSVAPHR